MADPTDSATGVVPSGEPGPVTAPTAAATGAAKDIDSADCGTSHWARLASGYVNDLSKEQAGVLAQFSARVSDDLLDSVRWMHETRDSCLCRFLRARKFDVAEALKMFTQAGEWRKNYGVVQLGRDSPEKLLGCRYEEFHRFYNHAFMAKPDKEGRPVYIEKTGRIDIDGLLAVSQHERMLHQHVHAVEGIQAQLQWRFSKGRAAPVDSVTTILDLEGMGRNLICSAAISYVKDIAKFDQDLFPEMCGHMVVVNAPGIFSMAWSIIKPMLDERTRSKIEIFSGEDQWKPRLLELIDADSLPVEYGGTMVIPGGLFPETDVMRTLDVSSGKRETVDLPKGAHQLRWFPRSGSLKFSLEYRPPGAAPDAEPIVLVEPEESSANQLTIVPIELPSKVEAGGTVTAVFDGSANWTSRQVMWWGPTKTAGEPEGAMDETGFHPIDPAARLDETADDAGGKGTGAGSADDGEATAGAGAGAGAGSGSA